MSHTNHPMQSAKVRAVLVKAHRKQATRWHLKHALIWGGLWLGAVAIFGASMVTAMILSAPAPAQRGGPAQYGMDYQSQQSQRCRSHGTDEDCDG